MDSIDLSPRKVKCVISKGRSLKKRKEINWKRDNEVCWTRVRVALGELCSRYVCKAFVVMRI